MPHEPRGAREEAPSGRRRGLRHLEAPLLSIGARTIADLSYLTPEDLQSVGVTKGDILNLSVTVVR